VKAFLDANLSVYLLVLENDELRRYSSFFSEVMRKYELYTDPIVIDEILWVCSKKYRIPLQHHIWVHKKRHNSHCSNTGN